MMGKISMVSRHFVNESSSGNAPFFTICIPCFNAGNSLRDCLSSIAVQDCGDYEVVVVDDGSVIPVRADDFGSLDLPCLRIVRIENSGPYAARRAAFDAARGEVIVCVDADDGFLSDSALDAIKRVFDSADPDVVLFNATSDGASRFLDFSALEGDSSFLDVCSVKRAFATDFCLNSMWSKAFKKKLLTRDSAYRKQPRLLMAEDRLQSLEIVVGANSFSLVDEPLYFYKENLGSTTHSAYKPEYYFQSCYVEDRVRESLDKLETRPGDWATFFLRQTSSALRGICCNRGLAKAQRREVYERMNEEGSLREAFRFGDFDALPFSARVKLGLLKKRRYALLDACMLPRTVGSLAKHILSGARD